MIWYQFESFFQGTTPWPLLDRGVNFLTMIWCQLINLQFKMHQLRVRDFWLLFIKAISWLVCVFNDFVICNLATTSYLVVGWSKAFSNGDKSHFLCFNFLWLRAAVLGNKTAKLFFSLAQEKRDEIILLFLSCLLLHHLGKLCFKLVILIFILLLLAWDIAKYVLSGKCQNLDTWIVWKDYKERLTSF